MDAEVRREVVLEEPVAEVWQALTDPERLAEWFANDVELDARRDGSGVFRWDDGSVRHAVVEELEPQRRFGFRWYEPGCDESATHVELTLEELPEGTRLVVVEAAPVATRASALAGEWSWGVSLLAALPRLRRLVPA